MLLVYEENYVDYNSNWKYDNELQDKNWFVQYSESFYWAIATIMLIGTKGNTPLETSFACLTLLLTVGVFAYIISKISMIIEELNESSQQYKRDLEIINRYMDNKEIEQQLQSKVRSFLEYVYKASGETDVNKNAVKVIQEKLPKTMKEQIQTQINENIMRKFPFMWQNFSQKTLAELLLIMEEQTCVTNEYIFQQGESIDPSLYLIIKGQVHITYTSPNSSKHEFVISHLKAGDVTGDVNLISGIQYQYSAKCTTFVNVCRIKRQQFLEILKQNEDDFERFHMIQEEFIFRQSSNYYARQCLCCQKLTHYETTCNLLVYRPNVYSVAMKYNFITKDQDRLRFKRFDNVFYHSVSEDVLYELQLIKEKLYLDPEFLEYMVRNDIQEDSDDEDEEYYEYIQEQEQNKFNVAQQLISPMIANPDNFNIVKRKGPDPDLVKKLISQEDFSINNSLQNQNVNIESSETQQNLTINSNNNKNNNNNQQILNNKMSPIINGKSLLDEQCIALQLLGGDENINQQFNNDLTEEQTNSLIDALKNQNMDQFQQEVNTIKQSQIQINLKQLDQDSNSNNEISINNSQISRNQKSKFSMIKPQQNFSSDENQNLEDIPSLENNSQITKSQKQLQSLNNELEIQMYNDQQKQNPNQQIQLNINNVNQSLEQINEENSCYTENLTSNYLKSQILQQSQKSSNYQQKSSNYQQKSSYYQQEQSNYKKTESKYIQKSNYQIQQPQKQNQNNMAVPTRHNQRRQSNTILINGRNRKRSIQQYQLNNQIEQQSQDSKNQIDMDSSNQTQISNKFNKKVKQRISLKYQPGLQCESNDSNEQNAFLKSLANQTINQRSYNQKQRNSVSSSQQSNFDNSIFNPNLQKSKQQPPPPKTHGILKNKRNQARQFSNVQQLGVIQFNKNSEDEENDNMLQSKRKQQLKNFNSVKKTGFGKSTKVNFGGMFKSNKSGKSGKSGQQSGQSENQEIDDEIIKIVEQKMIQNQNQSGEFDMQEMIRLAQEEVNFNFFLQFEFQKNFKVYCPYYNLSYITRIYKEHHKKKKHQNLGQSTLWDMTSTLTNFNPLKTQGISKKYLQQDKVEDYQ